MPATPRTTPLAAPGLPGLDPPSVTFVPSLPNETALDRARHVVVLLEKGKSRLRGLPYGALLAARLARAGGDEATSLVTELPNRTGTRLALATVARDASTFDLLARARALAEALRVGGGAAAPREITALVSGSAGFTQRATDAILAALVAADFPLPRYLNKPAKAIRLAHITIHAAKTVATKPDLTRTLATQAGNNLARWLTALPPNHLTPARYRTLATRLARREGWQVTFHTLDRLERLGAGAFLSVAQGSPRRDAGILHLVYRPPGRPRPRAGTRRPALALVGKGICFDTGGTNLKPWKSMLGMHEDMQGSAVALGTLVALSRLEVPYEVHAWLALAENHIGPEASRPHEIVRALNGDTIEIVHTDAEGRMVLADTLALAARMRPKLILDFATLTGACVGALATRMSGVLTNRPKLHDSIIRAGTVSGERVWPFPIEDDYAEALKSRVADVKQCSEQPDADQILAAVFLRRFVPKDIPWIHVDLAAGNHKGGLAHIPSDVSGFGVRFAAQLLQDVFSAG